MENGGEFCSVIPAGPVNHCLVSSTVQLSVFRGSSKSHPTSRSISFNVFFEYAKTDVQIFEGSKEHKMRM